MPLYAPDNEETAASSTGERGCFFGFLLPPLMVLLIGGFLAAFSWNAARYSPAASIQTKRLAPLFTPEVLRWSAQLEIWAANAEIDPNLAATVMQIESCGNPLARSHAGAAGLFQVMPYHFLPGENPFTPETNALRGLNYLKKCLDAAGGEIRLALAGYNGGISVISRAPALWSEETRRYVYWGTGIYEDARQNRSDSARLREWLSSGGASLCASAH